MLGDVEDSTVARHENFARRPDLETALRYSAVLGTDPRELFAGLFERTQEDTYARAERLLRKLEGQLPTKALAQKVEFLGGMSGTLEPHYVPEREDSSCPEC